MIYTLHIDMQVSGVYTARILHGNVELFDFEASSISVAIRGCGSHTASGLEGAHIWYGHVCIGTTSLHAMRHDAETLAQRLVGLHLQFGG
ncbi:hypothetical protein ABN448_19950 [Delftia acidovorans]|jgi:hypothetical protein|uniref:hypothetical protein n=1 Tax=Delftia acidovorans TaxID=80866 RepID=UPI0032DF9B1A